MTDFTRITITEFNMRLPETKDYPVEFTLPLGPCLILEREQCAAITTAALTGPNGETITIDDPIRMVNGDEEVLWYAYGEEGKSVLGGFKDYPDMEWILDPDDFSTVVWYMFGWKPQSHS